MAYNGDWTPPPDVVDRLQRREAWRAESEAMLERLSAEYERREREVAVRWLSGAPNVSMDISYEMKGWGDD